MKQGLFILCLIVCFSLSSITQLCAQDNDIFHKDSLKTERLILEIKKLGIKDSMLFFSKVAEAEKLIRKNDFKFLKGSVLLRKAVFAYDSYQYEQAENYVDSAYRIFHALKGIPDLELWKSHALQMKAVLYGLRGDAEKEQETLLRLIPIYLAYKDSSALRNVYFNLGVLYFGKTQYDKALSYFSKHFQIKKGPIYSSYIGLGALNMAMTYNEMDSIVQMEKYLDIAQKELSAVKDSLAQWAFYYHLRGQSEIRKKNYKKAIVYNHKGLRFSKKINDYDNIHNNEGGLATAYYALGMYKEAYTWEKAYYAYTKSSANYSHYASLSLKRLADISQKMGHPDEAYRYLQEHVALTDSIREDEVTKRLHALEEEFQSAQKEKKIAQLQYDNERKDWRLQQNRIWIFGSIALVLALLALAFLLFMNSRKQKRIHVQDQDLHRLELSKLDQELHIQALSSLIQGAETERRRLGRDLHDGLGGLLSGIKLKLNNLIQDGKTVEGKEVKQDLDNAIEEMRAVSQSLLPDMLEKYGLSEALKQFCARLSTKDLNIDFQSVNVDESQDKDRELMFYRIAQELVNNAVKHADAKEVLVQIQKRDDQLFLTVEDDGKGFDERESKGLGLANLKQRVQYLKGSFEISSQTGEGTSIYVVCPI